MTPKTKGSSDPGAPGPVLRLADEAATAALGRALTAIVGPGDVIALWGDLGAGKTSLARALIQTLLAAHGLEEEVPSPTFTLVQIYEMPGLTVGHADFYRIGSPEEIWQLGLDDLMEQGLVIAEWPERWGEDLPAERLDIHLAPVPEGGRLARLVGHGARWKERLEGFGQE